MRNIVFKDKTIPEKEYAKLLTQYTAFHKKTSGLSPTYVTIDYNFSDYPTVLDSDGDDRVTDKFMNELVAIAETRYGKYGTDNIKLLIHLDNWKSGKTATRKGIWGTNFSYKYGVYHVQYLRWDDKNIANSFGTFNHEDDHSYDALIQTEIGVDVRPILGVANYDRQTTHGQAPAYHSYIKYQENADKLKVLGPYLKAAYAKRLERHTEAVKGKQRTIISLLEKLVYLYKQRLNKKDGNPNPL